MYPLPERSGEKSIRIGMSSAPYARATSAGVTTRDKAVNVEASGTVLGHTLIAWMPRRCGRSRRTEKPEYSGEKGGKSGKKGGQARILTEGSPTEQGQTETGEKTGKGQGQSEGGSQGGHSDDHPYSASVPDQRREL
mgnify:CR=1 FL=1